MPKEVHKKINESNFGLKFIDSLVGNRKAESAQQDFWGSDYPKRCGERSIKKYIEENLHLNGSKYLR